MFCLLKIEILYDLYLEMLVISASYYPLDASLP